MEAKVINPAEEASVVCLNKVIATLKAGKSFRLEAGAGAGKTYTLIKALKFLIDVDGPRFLKANKRIACITYTNVAKDEIQSRTDNHPVIYAETIHAFCWELIKVFQKSLRSFLPSLTDRWGERCAETPLVHQEVIYNLGYPKLTSDEAFLHHDDVIKLMALLLGDAKFRNVVKTRFPVILIDEYQDTSRLLAPAIVNHFIEGENGPLIGFFGDHWQKIYGSSSIGLITAPAEKMEVIGKNANFRSDRLIVESLNRMRPELPQNPADPTSLGEVTIFHSNNWTGIRRTEAHWKDDLPEIAAHDFMSSARIDLEKKGWSFNAGETKILMLTNNVLAAEQGYHLLLSVFPDTEDLLKKNHPYISFLVDIIEPAARAFNAGKYGEMFKYLNLKSPKIRVHADKVQWHQELVSLVKLRETGTIGQVIEHIKKIKRSKLPERILNSEKELQEILQKKEAERTAEETATLTRLQAIRSVPFRELSAFSNFVDDKTLFSTKHGVKGAQFENVMVILGRGWNLYNWNQMLEWAPAVPKDKVDAFERNRNLFYVACSRPQKRLALVFTQKLSDNALAQLRNWFAVAPITPA